MALEIRVRGNMEVLLRGRQHAMTMMQDYSQIAHCAISVFDPDAPGLSEFRGEIVGMHSNSVCVISGQCYHR